MPLRVAACAIVAIGCLALPLRAAAGELEYHATLDAAVEAAEKGRLLVMIVVVAPVQDKEKKDICKLLREETLGEEQIAKLVRRHFAPFLFDIALVREGKQQVPPVIQACFKPNEQISVPQVIFLDAKCKEVGRIVGYMPPQGYIGLLRKVIEKATGLTPEKERREAKRALERGKEAISKEDYAAAFDALNSLVGGMPGEDQDAAKLLIEEIEAKGGKKLQEGIDLEAKDKLGSAVRAYRQCARGFKGTEAAGKAAARLVEIQKDPAIRKKLNTYMAAKLLAKAQEDVRQTRYGAAIEALDTIAARYADGDDAAEAKKLRDQLAADPDAARGLRDAKVRSEAQAMLSLGDSFRRNKMPEKAIAEYRKVVEKFPDTTFAKLAQERIAEATRELER